MDLWTGTVLVSGLSDTHSERWARMRVLIRPYELLGCITDSPSPCVAVRRLLLLGCRLELDPSGDSILLGPPTISRPVAFKPYGEASERAAFHAALQRALGAPAPAGLALVTTTSSLPQPTLCLLSLASNKHRAVLVAQPVVAAGFEEGGGAVEAAQAVGGEGEGSEDGGAAAQAPLVKLIANMGAQTLYLKVGTSCRLKGESSEHTAGAMEVAPVRTIFRVHALMGLLSFKAQGGSQRMRVRAVDLEAGGDVALLLAGGGGGARQRQGQLRCCHPRGCCRTGSCARCCCCCRTC